MSNRLITESVIIDHTLRVFRATFTGLCGNCQGVIDKGDPVRYTSLDPDLRMLIGDGCCGDADVNTAPAGQLHAFTDDMEEQSHVRPELVMPRGRGNREICRKCFQIPASNGVCGCA